MICLLIQELVIIELNIWDNICFQYILKNYEPSWLSNDFTCISVLVSIFVALPLIIGFSNKRNLFTIIENYFKSCFILEPNTSHTVSTTQITTTDSIGKYLAQRFFFLNWKNLIEEVYLWKIHWYSFYVKWPFLAMRLDFFAQY